MRQVLLRGLRARSRRFVGTFLAIFLGVAFLAGTLVLGDTLASNFDDLFTDANAGTDVVVRNATDISTNDSIGGAPISASLVATAREVDGVAAAEPSVQGYGQIVGRDGDLIGGNGPPTIAGNWIDDPALNPYELADGRAPQRDDEVVVNRGAAKDGDLALGDTIQVRVPEPVEVHIVGIATFGGEDGLGPTTFTGFTLDAAQRNFTDGDDQITSVVARGDGSVSEDELARRVTAAMPAGTETITGTSVTDENVSDINDDFLGGFRTLLVVFSAIAMVVASFSISNTFAIVVAQRTHESALLRALGASRGQILGSVVVESLAVGAIASAVGVLGGLGIATALKGLFAATGFDALPTGGLVVHASAVLVSFGVGVGVALLAGISPAVRAARVAPLAALRESDAESPRLGRGRRLGAPLAAVGGIALVVAATVGGSVTLMTLGALLTLGGAVTSGPVVARPLSKVLGAPVAAARGVTGSLARDNARRNPRRTSRTASALLVGVAVVTLFTVFAASVKASIENTVTNAFTGDLAITAGVFGGSGFSPELATQVAGAPGVAAAVGLGSASAQLDGDAQPLTIADPAALAAVTDLDVDGSLGDLGNHELAVAENVADDNGWRIGDTVDVAFGDGTTEPFTVVATYERSAIVGPALMSRDAWAPHARQDIDTTVLIGLSDGTSMPDGKAAVEQVAAGFGAPDVLDRSEYVDDLTSGIDMALGIVYVLLALAILIAAMGIANTLSLSIHERRRELGLLRAVGQDRAQTRAMVRWESVIVAVFGTVGGILLGTFLGWGVLSALAAGGGTPVTTFSLPLGPLLVVLVVGGLAGVLAGIRPARRAARVDILAALAAT
jgi:putative ABC transport system permease protein